MSKSNPLPSSQTEVGYGRPPAKHRFRKGVSGNPRGRPRKKPAEPVDSVLSHYLNDIVSAEAIRLIQVRENDEIVEMPMIQAVLRSLSVAAVKGSHRAQLAIVGLVKAAQDKNLEDRAEIYQTATAYKREWEETFKRYDQRGEPRPEPVPHPDEIVVDPKTLLVSFNGPETPDEKKHWDRMLDRRRQALEEVAEYRKKLRRPSKYAHFYQAELESEERVAEIIGVVIPDEATRREPGFNIREWRKRQGAMEKLKRDWRKKKAAND